MLYPFAKMYKKWGMFNFFVRDWEKKNKKDFHIVEIENDILYKTSVPDGNWLHTMLVKP